MIDFAGEDATPEWFEHVALRQNKPCIFRRCVLDDAPLRRALCSLELHVLGSDDGNDELRQLCQSELAALAAYDTAAASDGRPVVAELEVPVEIAPRECAEMTLKTFLVRQRGLFTSLLQDSADSNSNSNDNSWYLKDWHFVELWQKIAPQQTTPLYLLPTFLREFAQDCVLQQFQRSSSCALKFGRGSDYRFVYAGGAGSKTLVHHDVAATYSFSVNISGTKLWKLHIRDPDNDPDGGRVHEVLQHPGDVMFVPALLVHSVDNLTSCVSFNHNWYVFPFSVPFILSQLEKEARAAIANVDPEVRSVLSRNKDEWKQVVNAMLSGANAWSFGSVACLFKFALTKEEGTSENVAAVLTDALVRVGKLEEQLLVVDGK